MAKKKYTIEQFSGRTEQLTDRQQRAIKGGYKNIPTAGAGSFGLVTWETVDIRRPHQYRLENPFELSTVKPRVG